MLHDIAYYYLVLHDIAYHYLVLHGIAYHYLVLHGIAWCGWGLLWGSKLIVQLPFSPPLAQHLVETLASPSKTKYAWVDRH